MQINYFAFGDIDNTASNLEEQNARCNDWQHVIARILIFVFEQKHKRYNDAYAQA